MTTKVTVEANHGWSVLVEKIVPLTKKNVGQTIVKPGEKQEFYIHNELDLKIHEVQPWEVVLGDVVVDTKKEKENE